MNLAEHKKVPKLFSEKKIEVATLSSVAVCLPLSITLHYKRVLLLSK